MRHADEPSPERDRCARRALARLAPRATSLLALATLAAATTASPTASALAAGRAVPPGSTVALERASAVRIGRAPAVPPGAEAVGRAPLGERVTLTFVLSPRDPAAVSSLARAVSDPGSPEYHHYLPPGGFDRRFGPSRSTVVAAERALRSIGLDPSGTGPDGRSVRVVTTVRDAERSLRTPIEQYELDGKLRALANSSAPALPRPLAATVDAVLGLDTVPAGRPAGLVRIARGPDAGARVVSATGEASRPAAAPSPLPSCATAAGAAGYTADQLAGAYGFDGVYSTGDLGAGVSVGLVEFSTITPSDIDAYASCYGLSDPAISVVPVDGGPSASDPSNVVEAELDVEDLVGLAPASHLVVYEGADAGGGVSGSAAYDVYATAVHADAVQVLSTSWGGCEQSVGSGAATAEDVLFEQAAIQGQTVVAAAGDNGSEDCYGSLHGAASTSLAVDDPASQPYVTGVGGTTLDIGGSPAETVWNTTLDGSSPGAGGGGVSELWAMPSYQTGAAPSLGVVGPSSTCGPGVASPSAGTAVAGAAVPGGDCREVPDVSANAGAPYAIYCTAGVPVDCASGGWTGLGGTSAAAPTWAALFALADASARCATSGPVGFANPALYLLASRSYPGDFNDVTIGSNDLTGTNPGRYSAAPGYDLASGLGSPVAWRAGGGGLVADLCAPEAAAASSGNLPLPTVTSVTPHVIRARAGVHVTITGTNLAGATAVRFGAVPALAFTVRGSTSLVAVAPDGRGTVHVRVTTRAGTSDAVAADEFDYLVRPVLARVVPPSGPGRGRSVVLVGSGFDGVLAVFFGARPALAFAVRSPTRILAVAPPGRGTVVVTVRTRGGTSARLAGDRFSYVAAP